MARTKKMVYLALLVSGGVALHIVEGMIPVPFPVPGAKLGLANIISLLAIIIYGTKEGLGVNVLRCLIGSLLGGSMSSLIYSLSGAVLSTLTMGMAVKYFDNVFSLVGVSILGSVTHNFTQVTVASIVLSTFGLYYYLPFLMIVAIFTGIFTGFAANFAKDKLLANIDLVETYDRRR